MNYAWQDLSTADSFLVSVPGISINEPDVDIVWSDGSGNSNLNVTSEGTFYATISNQCGSSSDSVEINFLPPAPLLDLGADQSLCPGMAGWIFNT
ncbi:MAG TPA: hypothetical protein VFG10_13215 [Saprospiraceae bacterium]|nr:hypothetical protein [Saprospiraceae bacterium]